MTAIRHNVSPKKSPSLTGGEDEQPRAACRDDLRPFEDMHNHHANSRAHRSARRDAARVCRGCPLFDSCEFAVRGAA